MIHARKDYDHIQDPSGKIPLDEPVFLVRGQDPDGWRTVASWIACRFNWDINKIVISITNSQELLGDFPDDPLALALRLHAKKMMYWANSTAHGPADTPTDQLRTF